MNTIKAAMTSVFNRACEELGIRPVDHQLGVRSSATFLVGSEAAALAGALQRAGATNVVTHHWDPAECEDFDRHEWQVCWD